MFNNFNRNTFMDIIIGRQNWNNYLESWLSWSKDWTGNSSS
ncbi:hypothetical protein OAN24_03800 [Pseudodesulfovibrio sp.]|nr:hypothetical protein [Pseudodesulfovibrio sp.]